MKKCLVIGGGFAGLTASAYLVNIGFEVELIEASPKLGGRAYSFIHTKNNTVIDNGQHIMMGCYSETLNFFSLIGALDKVQVQEKLDVRFLKPNFDLYELSTLSLLYPFNLIAAILKYSAVSFRERLSILRFFTKLPFFANRDLMKMTVDELLLNENQNENVRKAFWEIICVGALNTNLNKASAKIFSDILKKIFFKGNEGTKIVLPKTGLSEMLCEPAKLFIEQRGGRIFLSERVNEMRFENGRVIEVKTDKRRIIDFDFVVCAVPYYVMQRIMLESNSLILNNKMLKPVQHYDLHSTNQPFNPQYSSILNVHIWLRENRLDNNFYALIDSKLHWVFSHASHLTCVISDADYLMSSSDDKIMDIVYSELDKYLNISTQAITDHLIIKEKRATFIPSIETLNSRPNTETELKNLFLAGDWINTGLPSTIEGAVKSGKVAADLVIKNASY